MFFHRQELQFTATPDKPDAIFARRMQEVLGSQYGEITVAMQYGFQAWNAHIPGTYRDLLYGIGAEEFGRVMLADFTANANAEMQGRVQVARIYNMPDDHGVREMLSFLLARDTMHQNQWIRAAQELREEGVEDIPVPLNFPLSNEARDHSYKYINFSDGQAAAEGSWASGPTPDGKGEFTYLDGPDTSVPMPPPTQPDPCFYGTDAKPNLIDKAEGVIKDKLS